MSAPTWYISGVGFLVIGLLQFFLQNYPRVVNVLSGVIFLVILKQYLDYRKAKRREVVDIIMEMEHRKYPTNKKQE